MKILTLGSYLFLLGFLAACGTGCYEHRGEGVGVDVTVHDSRWHYDHDHDDNWRANHPWYNDHRYDGQ